MENVGITLTPSLIIGIIGAMLTIASFFVGRTTAANKSGREAGRTETQLDNLAVTLAEIKGMINTQAADLRELNSAFIREKGRIDAAWKWIDEQRAAKKNE